jgi:DNA invertase Pin-like site-specific DNA recombinase
MDKYFLYARKSTDEEDRQVLSIEAQIDELKEFAAKEKLEIVASLCEAKTAKEPGRKVFNEMLKRIENNEANGIIAWHPDRLARNPIDGGQVIYLTDRNKIQNLKFPTFWFENTPQGKFMLNIAFGQSKYYVDNLSENVKRGLRQKLRRGEWPSMAPLGYFNDFKSRKVLVEKREAGIIIKLFDKYSTGDWTLQALADWCNNNGLKSHYGKPISKSMIQRILVNSFYCGVFTYNSETYQGTHETIIKKDLFDRVQQVMKKRGRARPLKRHSFPFLGLIKCASFGGYITAESQKGHTYYRCTKKKGKCDGKYLREEELVEQMKSVLTTYSIRDDWADKMLNKLGEEKERNEQTTQALANEEKIKLNVTEKKLESLLDAKLERIITTKEYLSKKEKIINDKVLIEEKYSQFKGEGLVWLEPMKDLILTARQAKKVADSRDPGRMRNILKNIGSNFLLKGKTLNFAPKKGWSAVPTADCTDWCP